MNSEKPQILLTNDDGIQSPGLWAAAEALANLGYVTVVAPREQHSGMGRSLPSTADGIIRAEKMTVHGKEWTVYAVGGSPAQAVLHGLLEIMPTRPDLVVSGINYGENVGEGISASGTIGATLEAASAGIPAMAVSLEVDGSYHYSYSREIDFSTAAHFTGYFGRLLLGQRMPKDVDVLKVDVPANATPDTPWEITRLSRQPYFISTRPERASWDIPANFGYYAATDPEKSPTDSDIYTLRVKHLVSVTPLSIDMTSRVDLKDLARQLKNNNPKIQ